MMSASQALQEGHLQTPGEKAALQKAQRGARPGGYGRPPHSRALLLEAAPPLSTCAPSATEEGHAPGKEPVPPTARGLHRNNNPEEK